MIWHSIWFLLLLVPLVLLALKTFLNRNSNRAAIQFSRISHLAKTAQVGKVKFKFLPTVFKFLALALMVVALARPQKADELIRKNVDGIDIVITLDISDSMLIEDMKPENRLESAKATIRDFIKGRNSDRIGLVLFMGEAFTKIPPTLDYEMILNELKDIQPSRTIKMGTAIGVALANSVARLKDSTAKGRVVVLLTDGENNSGTIDPLTALEIAKGYGIKVYTIGIGKDGETRLPIYSQDPFGNTIKRYQPFHSTVNEELLKQMANDTGGKYWRATSTTGLEDVFKEIDRLEKTKIDVNKFTRYSELFRPWLLWSLFFYFVAFILEKTWLRKLP